MSNGRGIRNEKRQGRKGMRFLTLLIVNCSLLIAPCYLFCQSGVIKELSGTVELKRAGA